MTGTMSEMELSVLRQRSLEALKQKARRGELFMTVAVGYVRVGHNHDCARLRQVHRDAVGASGAPLVQTRARSVARRHLSRRRPRGRVEAAGLQDDPAHSDQPDLCRHICIRAHRQPHQRRGRRKKVVRGFKREREDWEVLIPNHHEGYLSWADHERNLGLIADNANGKNPMSRVPCAEVRLCSPACCAVRIVGANFTSTTSAGRQHPSLPLSGQRQQ